MVEGEKVEQEETGSIRSGLIKLVEDTYERKLERPQSILSGMGASSEENKKKYEREIEYLEADKTLRVELLGKLPDQVVELLRDSQYVKDEKRGDRVGDRLVKTCDSIISGGIGIFESEDAIVIAPARGSKGEYHSPSAVMLGNAFARTDAVVSFDKDAPKSHWYIKIDKGERSTET